jgi:guanosine-3',5'-bis(diphosphate) 3'-pyrophosphohydrolase
MTISITSPASEILRAAVYAAERHSQQQRKDKAGAPYINHPIGVAEILTRVAGVTDTELIQAAILHDTLEDTTATPEELESLFGPRVRSIVSEVTDDTSLPKPESKQMQVHNAPRLTREARLIRIADKIYNCSEITPVCPVGWSQERKLEYLVHCNI